MRRYGLASVAAQQLLCEMESQRSDWDACFRHFRRYPQTEMQSINRKLEEYYEMAVKAKKAIAREPKSPGEFTWKGFVDVKLTDTDKANLAAWDVSDSDVWDGIAQYCEAGIKVAVSYNAKNASFTCAGTGQASSGENNGYCVVAYAKTPYDAARVWLFKVATMLPAVWCEYDVGDSDDIG